MIQRPRTPWRLRRHPRSGLLSRYLDGDLDAWRRRALETHLRDCPGCQQELESLADIVRALSMLEPDRQPGLADSITAALRAEPRKVVVGKTSASGARVPALTLVCAPSQVPAGGRIGKRWSQEARTALRWCLQKPRLRLTLPIALVAGVVLSLVNMGGMLMHGRIDLGVCVSCAINFLVPFLALNLGLFILVLWAPSRERL